MLRNELRRLRNGAQSPSKATVGVRRRTLTSAVRKTSLEIRAEFEQRG